MALWAQVYGVDAGDPATFDLQLGDPEPTRNPDLVRAMKMLAVRRDMDARHRVYVAVMNATFLVPVNPAGITVDEPLEVDRLGAFPVIAAFTEIDSLRLWQPKGWPFALIPGARLVPLAVARRVGSLLINPRGNVGGELYINELEAIEGALRRRNN
ncbi:MAG TPA: SseB family protein, partial [Nannocystis sp.]